MNPNTHSEPTEVVLTRPPKKPADIVALLIFRALQCSFAALLLWLAVLVIAPGFGVNYGAALLGVLAWRSLQRPDARIWAITKEWPNKLRKK